MISYNKWYIMINFQEQFDNFKLSEELKIQFFDFESDWGTKQSSIKSYRVITIVNVEFFLKCEFYGEKTS
jgi:hypothetical protein